jgi:hypothetical protein
MHNVPQPGQVLWVEAMSNPHSGQKRPPPIAELQFGHFSPPPALAAASVPADDSRRSPPAAVSDLPPPLVAHNRQSPARAFQHSSSTAL